MKIVITGSLGNIGKPLAIALVEKGHSVTVISSNPDKKEAIGELGAVAAIGSVRDGTFLAKVFTGADAVYCMIPPDHSAPDPLEYYKTVAGSYAQAIRQSGVKRVVHLSSYGAELPSGTGIILGSHFSEGILNGLAGVTITHVRPTYFYYNLNVFIGMIKQAGHIASNYGGDKLTLVSPIDIAAAIADEITTPMTGRTVRYVASDELTGQEIATILGEAIGMPELKWVVVSDERMRSYYDAWGLRPAFADRLIELSVAIRTGRLAADFYGHKPALGKVKLKDYAPAFAAAFGQNR